MVDGQPIMKVKDTANIELAGIIHIKNIGASNYKDISDLFKDHHCRKIDLTHDWLYTFELIKDEDNNECYLSYCIHHIIADGWSSGVLISELLSIYNQLKRGEFEESLPSIQYVDYSFWLNKHIKSLDISKKYWQEQLIGYNTKIQWLNSNLNSERSFKGNELHFKFEKKQVDILNNLANDSQSTLFMVAISLVNILLYKYSNERDIVVGTDFSGRNMNELEDQIGYFLKLIPLRTQIKTTSSYKEYLSSVKRIVLEAFEHQDYPIEYMMKDIEEQTNKKVDLFNVLVLFQNFNNIPDFKDFVPNVEITQLPEANNNALLDLTFEFAGLNEQMELKIRYKTDVFESWQIQGMWEQLNELIDSIAQSSSESINQLVIADQSVQPILSKPIYPSVIDCIDEFATEKPEAIALSIKGRNISYQELYSNVKRLARYLKNSKNLQERVGVFMDKNENAIISILAILKSGGVFVPIDSNYPEERVNYIIKDSGVSQVLCDRNNFDKLCNYNASIDILEVEQLLNGQRREEAVLEAISEDKLAYILYTSGSTGKPKGIMIDRRSLNYYVKTFLSYFKLMQEDKVIQQATLSFDTSIEEIFPTLCIGATLEIIEEGGKDIPSIKKAIEEGATVLSTTPVILNELNSSNVNIESLRLLISGGDVLKENHISNFIGRVPIYNTYGPTETTVCASYREVKSKKDLRSIGRSIDGKQILILDSDGNLLPIGVEGEICIGGEGIFRGYVGLVKLTNDSLVLLGEENIPFYKSGDRGYIDVNGEVIFRGRNDHQIKIRGQRIELSEIENKILLDKSIINVFVSTKLGQNESPELIAYLEIGGMFDFENFMNQISNKLPAYMVPKNFYKVDKFPVNSNGKVDIKQLRSNQYPLLKFKDDFVYSESITEEQVLGIWKKVLKRDSISVNSNFFHIGGDSLLLAKVKTELEAKFHIELSFKDLYEANTIQQTSQLIDRKQKLKINRKEFII